jgi:hypothetical protein
VARSRWLSTRSRPETRPRQSSYKWHQNGTKSRCQKALLFTCPREREAYEACCLFRGFGKGIDPRGNWSCRGRWGYRGIRSGNTSLGRGSALCDTDGQTGPTLRRRQLHLGWHGPAMRGRLLRIAEPWPDRNRETSFLVGGGGPEYSLTTKIFTNYAGFRIGLTSSQKVSRRAKNPVTNLKRPVHRRWKGNGQQISSESSKI